MVAVLWEELERPGRIQWRSVVFGALGPFASTLRSSITTAYVPVWLPLRARLGGCATSVWNDRKFSIGNEDNHISREGPDQRTVHGTYQRLEQRFRQVQF